LQRACALLGRQFQPCRVGRAGGVEIARKLHIAAERQRRDAPFGTTPAPTPEKAPGWNSNLILQSSAIKKWIALWNEECGIEKICHYYSLLQLTALLCGSYLMLICAVRFVFFVSFFYVYVHVDESLFNWAKERVLFCYDCTINWQRMMYIRKDIVCHHSILLCSYAGFCFISSLLVSYR
jgi:hypothetical protein